MPDHLNKNHRASLFWGGLRLSELTNETECAADIVCIDLEDSVPLDRKQDGRLALKQFLQTYKPTKSAQYMVRINSLDSEDGQSDLAPARISAITRSSVAFTFWAKASTSAICSIGTTTVPFSSAKIKSPGRTGIPANLIGMP